MFYKFQHGSRVQSSQKTLGRRDPLVRPIRRGTKVFADNSYVVGKDRAIRTILSAYYGPSGNYPPGLTKRVEGLRRSFTGCEVGKPPIEADLRPGRASDRWRVQTSKWLPRGCAVNLDLFACQRNREQAPSPQQKAYVGCRFREQDGHFEEHFLASHNIQATLGFGYLRKAIQGRAPGEGRNFEIGATLVRIDLRPMGV